MEEIKVVDIIDESTKEMLEVKEVKEEVKKETKPKYQEMKCKVVGHTSEFSIADFSGYGVTIPKTEEEFVIVKYTGSIGNANFKIIE